MPAHERISAKPAVHPRIPDVVRWEIDRADTARDRYDATRPKAWVSYTVADIEAMRAYLREMCQSRWLALKAIARWACKTKNNTGLTAISDREKFLIVCRMMKEARILRDAWEAKWRERLCLSDAAE